MAVAAGENLDARNFTQTAHRQRPDVEPLGQIAADDGGSVDRRIAEPLQKREPADMVLVAVAEHQRIERTKVVDIGQKPRRRTLAEVKHDAFAARFEHKAGWALGADARNQPQRAGFCAHEGLPLAGETAFGVPH